MIQPVTRPTTDIYVSTYNFSDQGHTGHYSLLRNIKSTKSIKYRWYFTCQMSNNYILNIDQETIRVYKDEEAEVGPEV